MKKKTITSHFSATHTYIDPSLMDFLLLFFFFVYLSPIGAIKRLAIGTFQETETLNKNQNWLLLNQDTGIAHLLQLSVRERCKKTKKSINDGFMYVCVAEKCEMMFFFVSTVVFMDNFPQSLGKKNKNDGVF